MVSEALKMLSVPADRLKCLMIDAVLSGFVGGLAFLLHFEFKVPGGYVRHLCFAVVVWMVVKPLIHVLGGLDRCQWRYASVPDAFALAGWCLAGSATSAAIVYLFGPAGFPRPIVVIEYLLCVDALIASRMLARVGCALKLRRNRQETSRKRVFIYGAGLSGAMLLRDLRDDPGVSYEVVGFIDDDPSKTGTLLQRVPVLGTGEDLARLAAKWRVSLALIAIPSCSARQTNSIIQRCRDARLPYRNMPRLSQLSRCRTFFFPLREISMHEVLGREPVRLDERHVRSAIEGEVVLVTGAAGSIGSELCRQLARFCPKAIIGFDIAETPLFHLEQEMQGSYPDVPFYCAIGSVRHELRLKEVFEHYRPRTVYHAAAYKHVPMMEGCVFEAFENNVLGTYQVAMAAEHASVDNFVLISSDKAVNPANIMGSTKRIAELVISAMQQTSATKFAAVRFGNVLGSNGSVVPIFRRQIEAGGPVTVTHPDMRRYFMTIPEAAQLVIQASTFAKGGEIFVLDMGEPVRIVDLARKLILLSGLRPDEDIKILFSGIRPGEKLYEELKLDDERTLPTPHEKIRVYRGSRGMDDVHERMQRIDTMCRMRHIAGLLAEIRRLVPGCSCMGDPGRMEQLPRRSADAAVACM